MNETTKRLYEAAEKMKGVSGQSAVAKLIGKTPQVLHNWESRGMSKAGIISAAETIGCSVLWLERGLGQMEQSVSSTAPPEVSGNPAVHEVPLYHRPNWDSIDDKGEPIRMISCIVDDASDETWACRVENDSIMDITNKVMIRKSDIVVIDPNKTPVDGSYVLATSSRHKLASLKVYKVQDSKEYLHTPNPDWQEKWILIDDTIEIHGVVIEVIKIV